MNSLTILLGANVSVDICSSFMIFLYFLALSYNCCNEQLMNELFRSIACYNEELPVSAY